MQALEFETYISGEFIKVPNVERLKSKYVKVILLYHEEESESALQLPNIFYTPVTRTHYEPFDRLENHCSVLYTEDLQHNQLIENSLKIVNPFN